MEVRIKQGEEMIDTTIEMVDGVMVVSPKEVKFEPKDGDVVYSKGCKDFVFVYQDNLTTEVCYYAALSIKDNKIELPYEGYIGYVSQLRPATEEEKKLLFDRLAEEGWEWKSDIKELVKIKWKPKYNDNYWSPSLFDSEFIPKMNIWQSSKIGNKRLGKGWVFKTKQECQEFCDKLNQAINQVKP